MLIFRRCGVHFDAMSTVNGRMEKQRTQYSNVQRFHRETVVCRQMFDAKARFGSPLTS